MAIGHQANCLFDCAALLAAASSAMQSDVCVPTLDSLWDGADRFRQRLVKPDEPQLDPRLPVSILEKHALVHVEAVEAARRVVAAVVAECPPARRPLHSEEECHATLGLRPAGPSPGR